MRAVRPGQSALLLLDVIDVLKREHVEYAVIGALAAAVHGTIRGSEDADALVALTVGGLPGLARELSSRGLAVELRRGDDDDPVPAMLLVGDAHGNRVDLLAGLRGLDPQALSRAVAIPFGGESLRVVALEDFIAMKCFAGGPQDLEDARNALRNGGQLDLDLTRRLTRRFGRPAADALEGLMT